MPLSDIPGGVPSLPDGAQKVSLKAMDTTSTTKNIDVTVFGDTARVYADPPLKDGTAGAPTATCTASGLITGSGPEVDAPVAGVSPAGWLCDEVEISYSVGEYATWSATYNYYEEE
jgi:hypothetical protein